MSDQQFAETLIPFKNLLDNKKTEKVGQPLMEQHSLAYCVKAQWQTDFQSAQRTYQEYTALVRSAYQYERHVLSELHLNQVAPTDPDEWLDYARFFYTNVPSYNALLDQQFGLKPEVWAQALVEIHALISARYQQ